MVIRFMVDNRDSFIFLITTFLLDELSNVLLDELGNNLTAIP